MEKESQYKDWSHRSLQHHKRNTVHNQVNAKSVCQRQGHETYQMILEKDIAKLQRQLKQEVDTHRTLERALTRSLGALPRFSPGLATEVQKLVAEVAVLEEEVVHLEEYLTVLHQGLSHDQAQHTGEMPKVRSETFAEGQPSPTARRQPFNNCEEDFSKCKSASFHYRENTLKACVSWRKSHVWATETKIVQKLYL